MKYLKMIKSFFKQSQNKTLQYHNFNKLEVTFKSICKKRYLTLKVIGFWRLLTCFKGNYFKNMCFNKEKQ